jgi:hypothetical protein
MKQLAEMLIAYSAALLIIIAIVGYMLYCIAKSSRG